MTSDIRHVRPGDIPALIDLATQTFLDSFGGYHTDENCQAFIAQSHNEAVYHAAIKDPAQLLLVAEGTGKFQSYLYAKPATLPLPPNLSAAHELSKIYTRRSAQGEGIGQRLIEAWEAWAHARDIKDLVLGVWSENDAAQRFYTRHNYRKRSEYKLTVGDVQDTDYIFHKAL